MIRAWIGLALLSGSWLLGLTYYTPAQPGAWLLAVVVGTVLLYGVIERVLGRIAMGVALLLLLPPIVLADWPGRIAPLWIALGLALQWLPFPRRWIGRLGGAAVAAGLVLLAQSLAVSVYAVLTSWSHDLPWPLSAGLTGEAWLLGVDADLDGSEVVLHSLRQNQHLAATWALGVDLATVCFLAGGVVLVALAAWSHLPRAKRLGAWAGAAGVLLLIVVAWLPLRAALLMAVYLHRDLRAAYDTPPHVMNHFFSPWVHLLLLTVPALLAWRWVQGVARASHPSSPNADQAPAAPQSEGAGQAPAPPQAGRWRMAAAAALSLAAAAAWTVAASWEPVGLRKSGRVMVVERHSTWEPTTRPYDTRWYGEPSGYNYAAIYDHCAHYFRMLRLFESDRIDDQSLAACDVLVIKIPTARYEAQEVAAVVRFVERGGGLLMIGDHTNFNNSGTYLNDVARRFGFLYRYDLLFGSGIAYDEAYRRARVPHPIVQDVPQMDFAVSCSIDPGWSPGRAAIRSTGLWSLPPDYNFDNYHPNPYHQPEMRCGAFVQLWALRHGRGRVAAFTDSTVFSNFCTFQPGKAELLLDMLQWLNYQNALGDRSPMILLVVLLVGLGVVAATCALLLVRRRRDAWLVLLAAVLCGLSGSSAAVAAWNRWAMPPPQPRAPDSPSQRMTCVVVDRTVSDVPLARDAFPQGGGDGYCLLEEWIPRLGYFTTRRSGPAALGGDALVVIAPRRPVSEEFCAQVERYVAEGGKLLVIDTPENTASTANDLLRPLGLCVRHEGAWQGPLILGGKLTEVPIRPACEVTGGQAIGRLGEKPIAARLDYGQGTVMALGFGSLWNDRNMGGAWTVEPDAATRARYDVLFAVLRNLVEGKPLDMHTLE